MSSEQPSNPEPTEPDATSQMSFMDKQFINASGCSIWFIIIMVPFLALVAGVIGLLTCKDPTARSRAGTMALVGGIWFAISLIILIGMVNSAAR